MLALVVSVVILIIVDYDTLSSAITSWPNSRLKITIFIFLLVINLSFAVLFSWLILS